MECPPGVLDQRLLRDNEMVLLEGTSWKHQAHAADGAARFVRKVIVVMRWDGFSNGLDRLARWLVTPQLMRRAVSRSQKRIIGGQIQ